MMALRYQALGKSRISTNLRMSYLKLAEPMSQAIPLATCGAFKFRRRAPAAAVCAAGRPRAAAGCARGHQAHLHHRETKCRCAARWPRPEVDDVGRFADWPM